MILEPNRQRRRRAFRAVALVALVLVLGSLLAGGWTPPAFSNAVATPSLAPGPSPTNQVAVVPTSDPGAILPSPSPAETTAPAPTPDAHGCFQPPAGTVPATVVSHGDRSKKQVALTFDDGTNPENVHRILGILFDTKVNATFFPTGRSVQLYPDVWKDLAGVGYPIANHTYSHQSLKGLCYQLQLAELLHDQAVIEKLNLTLLPVMRPPYEEFDDGTRFATSAAGESHVVLWDVDTMDWTGLSVSTIASRALAGRAGSIVLMHTSPVNTARALRTIISRYRARGFTFVTIGQMLGIPGPVPFP